MNNNLILNEIKQNKEGSGLGSLRIGTAVRFDPIILMMRKVNDEFFYIWWNDKGEPPTEEEFTIKYTEDGNLFKISVHSYCNEGDEVWMEFDKQLNIVRYKSHIDDIKVYNNANEFFKIFTNAKDIKDSIIQEMKSYLIDNGYVISEI